LFFFIMPGNTMAVIFVSEVILQLMMSLIVLSD